MSTWDDQYYEEDPDGYGEEPDPDDPLGILRRDRDAEADAAERKRIDTANRLI